MIPHGVAIFVSRRPVNMRLSFDRLAALVEAVFGRSPRCRAIFVFFGMRRETLKVLFHDGSGLCIFHKRLDRGRFGLLSPQDDADTVTLSEAELEALLDGLNLEGGARPRRPRERVRKQPTLHEETRSSVNFLFAVAGILGKVMACRPRRHGTPSPSRS